KNPKISELGLILLGWVRRGRSPSIEEVKGYFKNDDLKQFTLSNGIIDIFIVTKDKIEKEN
ncbi:MAG: hypothetical protein L6Q37_10270, partial [Bdellovibrionaceae bacterium]|nr:hypothetical protein [Pseudobdellovibrionaceae bacterium]